MGTNVRSDQIEDLFAPTRMSFGDHLEELRCHLWRAGLGFGVIACLCFFLDFLGSAVGWPIGVGKPMQRFIARPVERALGVFHDRRVKLVMASLDQEPELALANRPTEFVQLGFAREQLLAAAHAAGLLDQPVAGIPPAAVSTESTASDSVP